MPEGSVVETRTEVRRVVEGVVVDLMPEWVIEWTMDEVPEHSRFDQDRLLPAVRLGSFLFWLPLMQWQGRPVEEIKEWSESFAWEAREQLKLSAAAQSALPPWQRHYSISGRP